MVIDIAFLRRFAKQFGHSEALVLAELSAGPATKEELALRMDRTPRTIQTYLKPLVKAGLIYKNTVSHVWILNESVLINEFELNEKNISITNIHTDITKHENDLESLNTQNPSLESLEENIHTKIQDSSSKEKVVSVEHYKAARVASKIIFGQPLDPFVKEMAYLLKEFNTLDFSIIASAAHIVTKNVRSNPIMMFIATYRNKVRALQLCEMVQKRSVAERVNDQTAPKFYPKQNMHNGFVSNMRNDKYNVFYQLYEQGTK